MFATVIGLNPAERDCSILTISQSCDLSFITHPSLNPAERDCLILTVHFAEEVK